MSRWVAMSRWALLPLLSLATLSLATGCVSIGLGEAVVIDEAALDSQRVEVVSKRVHVDVEQDDTRLTVTADRECDIEERARVRRTVERERINNSPAITWQLAIYGSILAGIGTGITVDAQLNVEDSETDGQNYNPLGPRAATAIGVGFLAAGSPLLVIALIDGVRSTGTVDEISETQLPGRVVAKAPTCSERTPAVSAEVLGRTHAGTEIRLGMTDAQGVLEVDLADVVSEQIIASERAMSLALFIEKQHIGMADLKPVAAVHREAYADREEKAWGSVDADACAAGSGAECQALEKFLADYPQSPHAPEARAALAKGKAVIASREMNARREKEKEAAAAAAAAEAKRKKEEAAKVCRQKCSTGCNGNASCVQACVQAKCQL
jgi:hypothetical protein